MFYCYSYHISISPIIVQYFVFTLLLSAYQQFLASLSSYVAPAKVAAALMILHMDLIVTSRINS